MPDTVRATLERVEACVEALGRDGLETLLQLADDSGAERVVECFREVLDNRTEVRPLRSRVGT